MNNKIVELHFENDQVVIKSNDDLDFIIKNQVYKIRLKRYTEHVNIIKQTLYLKKGLRYPVIKKIINILSKDANKRNYDFIIDNEIIQYIKARELYIRERANLGIAIKLKNSELNIRYQEYKRIVNNSMIRPLREQQMWDSFFMCSMKKCSNFSVPGSGKTASVLGVFAYLKEIEEVNKLVVIGPKNSFGSWIDEFKVCISPELNIYNIQDYPNQELRRMKLVYESENTNLFLINYESISSVKDELIQIIGDNTLLIFDEVHKVKRINGDRALQAIDIAKDSQRTIALTGTPIPNSYQDIYNLLQILYVEEYDEQFNFNLNQLSAPDEQDKIEINESLQPFFCRTTKEQLLVPEVNDDIFDVVSACSLENKLYNIILQKYRNQKLLLYIRLMQLQSNPLMLLKKIQDSDEDYSNILDTSGEIDDYNFKNYEKDILELSLLDKNNGKFTECINRSINLLNENKSIIIWCIHIDSILKLAEELENKGYPVACIYGATSNEDRAKILDEFKSGKIKILITNPHTLAESISLHSVCHDAIYYEYSFNLVHLLQSKDRIHRLGLKPGQYTQYYYMRFVFNAGLENEFSLDQKIFERLKEKERIMLDAIENNQLEAVTTCDEDLELIFKDLKL